jgi:hypothetical protein
VRRVGAGAARAAGRARAGALAVALALAVPCCSGGGARYAVRIVNRDTVAVDSVAVVGDAIASRFGAIPPGGEASRTILVRRDVSLHLIGLRGDRPLRFFLGDYASRGPSGALLLTLTPGGELRVGGATPR